MQGYIQLAKATLRHIRTICGNFFIALASVLALMLTLLSFSTSLDIDFEWAYYQRKKQISYAVATNIVAAVTVYLLLGIPITKSNLAVENWYSYVYYTTLVLGSLIGGGFMTIILYIYRTIVEVINRLNPEESHELNKTWEDS